MFVGKTYLLTFIVLLAVCVAEELLSRTKRQGWKRRGGGLPPGLQKQKDRGSLPPGLEKHQNERGRLPPGLAKKESPIEPEDAAHHPDKGWKRRGGGLPPGLQKQKDRGSLPPGLEKHQNERGRLPPGLAKKEPPIEPEYPDHHPDKGDEYEPSYPDYPIGPDKEPNYDTYIYGEPGGPPINDSRALEELESAIRQTDARTGVPSATIIVYVPDARPYHKFENCRTPKNEIGHCRFLQYCILPDFLYNKHYFFNSLCLIRKRIAGVCCPDRYFTQYDNDNYIYPNTRPGTITKLQPPVTVPPAPRPTPVQTFKDCGNNYRTKIVGGIESNVTDWRWMAALMRNGKHFCGGALISKQYVITAAHCLNGYNESSIQVRLGEYDFERNDDSLAVDFNVISIIRHPQYDRYTYRNDICLLKLDKPTTFTEYTNIICLPNPNIDFTGLVGVVAGWGTLSFGGISSKTLHQVSLPIWNNSECDKIYAQSITHHFICAGSRQEKKDSCQGDSGGPLMVEGRDTRWMLAGIVSWGIRCADPGYPGVYTRVTQYLEWINFHMT